MDPDQLASEKPADQYPHCFNFAKKMKKVGTSVVNNISSRVKVKRKEKNDELILLLNVKIKIVTKKYCRNCNQCN